MKTISKKLLSLLLVVIMVASVLPFQALATPATACDKGHDIAFTYHAAAEETCKSKGHVEYWTCNGCGSTSKKYDTDGNVIDEAAFWIDIDADKHPAGKVSKIAANVDHCDYWRCSECGAMYSDEALTTSISKASEAAHNTTLKTDNCKYFECDICGLLFGYIGSDTLHGAVIKSAGHSMTHHAADPEYCEDWYCSKCNEYFSDEAGTASLGVTERVKHEDADDDGVCDTCGKTLVQSDPAPVDVTGKFTVTLNLKNRNNALVRTVEVSPELVEMAGAYIVESTFAPGGSWFYLPYSTDPNTKYENLMFDVDAFFTANPQQDKNNQDLVLMAASKKKLEISSTKQNVFDVTVDYLNPPVDCVVTFHTTNNAFFKASNLKNKTVYTVRVPYGEAINDVPDLEGKNGAWFTGYWATAEGSTVRYEMDASVLGAIDLYPVLNMSATTDSTLNVTFYGSKVTTVTKTLKDLNSSALLGAVLSADALNQMIGDFNYGFELVSATLYKVKDGAIYGATDTVATANANNNCVYVKVKPLTYTATFLANDGVVDGLIGNANYKVLKDLYFGQTKIEMPIPVAEGHRFVGWRETRTKEIYQFVDNTKMLLNYNFNYDATFEAVWDVSPGVFVNVYFNNITNRSLYTTGIYDLRAGDTLTVYKVRELLNKYFTWSDTTGLYTNGEWNTAVRTNFSSSAGNKDVDGVVITDAPRQEYNIMLLGAKQNGQLISTVNLSTIGIGVNANGAYAPADPTNPKTGNEAEMLGVAMASMVMAVITLAGVTYYTRKKEEMI